MGCVHQYQLCNPNKPENNAQCTSLSGRVDTKTNLASIGLNSVQTGVAQRLYYHISTSQWFKMVASAPTDILLANRQYAEALSIPDNQWILEMDHMFRSMFLSTQMWAYYYVTGDGNAFDDNLLTPPNATDKWMCDAQMIIRGDYSTFSITGVVIILVVGGFLIGLNMGLSTVVSFIRRRWLKKCTNKDAEWDALETAALLRLTYHLNGTGLSQDPVSAKPILAKVVEVYGDSRSASQTQSSLADAKQADVAVRPTSPTSPADSPNSPIGKKSERFHCEQRDIPGVATGPAPGNKH